MRILLAGATGVIGRQAVPVLTAAGHQVVGPANRPARLPGAEVVVAGGWAVAFMTSLAGASNLRARQRLGWQPTYSTWRDGLAAERSLARR